MGEVQRIHESMILRDYQQAAHAGVFREWQTVCNTLVNIPTGGGKTVLFAAVIKSMQPKRAMVVAHREELIWQARDKIQKFAGLECGIEMGELYVNNSLFGDLPVVISTVQTQNTKHGDRKRMSRFNPKEFGVLVVDECHRILGKTYRDLINYYKTNNPDIKILSVTATPDRCDQAALGQVIDSVAYDYEILDAIHDGWLVPIEQQFVSTTIDFSHIKTTAGDLNSADLAAVMEAESSLQQVALATIEIVGRRRTIVFTASVKQAEIISSIFNRHRSGMSEWVCGATNKDNRRDILRRFREGEVQVVANCGVLTEGFDDAGVECIAMARPTKSRALYSQCCGRSTRPLPGLVDGVPTREERKAAIAVSTKPSCLIIDYVGNSGRHKLMSSADILGGKVSDDAVAMAVKIAKTNGGAIRMSDALDEAEEKIRLAAEQSRLAEEARKARVLAKVKYASRSVNPFDVFDIQPVRERGWDNGRTLSEKQKSMLQRAGINPDTLPYAQAKQVLNEMFNRMDKHLCSFKQASLLKKHGYETKDLTMNDATKMISELANNGWKKPESLNPVLADNVPF